MTFELRQPPPQTTYALSTYALSTYLPTYLHPRRRRPHRHAYRMTTPPQSEP